jgi:hypothetical protein
MELTSCFFGHLEIWTRENDVQSSGTKWLSNGETATIQHLHHNVLSVCSVFVAHDMRKKVISKNIAHSVFSPLVLFFHLGCFSMFFMQKENGGNNENNENLTGFLSCQASGVTWVAKDDSVYFQPKMQRKELWESMTIYEPIQVALTSLSSNRFLHPVWCGFILFNETFRLRSITGTVCSLWECYITAHSTRCFAQDWGGRSCTSLDNTYTNTIINSNISPYDYLIIRHYAAMKTILMHCCSCQLWDRVRQAGWLEFLWHTDSAAYTPKKHSNTSNYCTRFLKRMKENRLQQLPTLFSYDINGQCLFFSASEKHRMCCIFVGWGQAKMTFIWRLLHAPKLWELSV